VHWEVQQVALTVGLVVLFAVLFVGLFERSLDHCLAMKGSGYVKVAWLQKLRQKEMTKNVCEVATFA
jgi:hypothetical protein